MDTRGSAGKERELPSLRKISNKPAWKKKTHGHRRNMSNSNPDIFGTLINRNPTQYEKPSPTTDYDSTQSLESFSNNMLTLPVTKNSLKSRSLRNSVTSSDTNSNVSSTHQIANASFSLVPGRRRDRPNAFTKRWFSDVDAKDIQNSSWESFNLQRVQKF